MHPPHEGAAGERGAPVAALLLHGDDGIRRQPEQPPAFGVGACKAGRLHLGQPVLKLFGGHRTSNFYRVVEALDERLRATVGVESESLAARRATQRLTDATDFMKLVCLFIDLPAQAVHQHGLYFSRVAISAMRFEIRHRKEGGVGLRQIGPVPIDCGDTNACTIGMVCHFLALPPKPRGAGISLLPMTTI